MATYLVQRLLQMIPVLLLVTVISFSLTFLLPGDPALLILGDQMAADEEAYRAVRTELGLDRPVPIQYLDWLSSTARGDLGRSTRDGLPVFEGIVQRLPVTLELSFLSMLIALVIALPAGIVSAVKKNTRWDISFSLLSLWGVAIPHFWLGILLIYAFAVYLKVLPPSGYVSFSEDPMANLRHMILPAVTLGVGLSAVIMRQVRSSLLEVLQQDYIVTARSKGLASRSINLEHALKNGLIPVVTIIGLQVGLLFGGAVITESIFSLPGVGRWAVDSILWRDFPVVQAVSLVMAIGVLVTNLVTDMVYAFIDPRIRHQS